MSAKERQWNRLVLFVAMTTYACGASANDPTFIEEIAVVGRQLNLIGSATSASEGLVSNEELDLRPLLRVGEVMESVPGLVATQHSGSGKANQFFLRGFNLDHGTDFATHIDDMPVNMRSHGHGQGYTDLNFLIPELIESLAFTKGSYDAASGDFSGAGSARISSATSELKPTLSLGGGDFGFHRILLTGSTQFDGGRFTYGAEQQGYDGPWDSIDENINRQNLWLKQRWGDEETGFDLMLMAYDNTWNSADQIPQRAVDNGQITEFGSIDPSVGGNSSRYSLSSQWRGSNSFGAVKAGVYAIDYDMNLYSNFSYFTQAEGDQFRQIDDRRIYGGQLSQEWNTRLANLPLNNIFGVQLRVDDIAAVGLQSTQQREFLADTRIDSVNEKSAAIYWQNEIKWTSKLRTTSSLRYDWFNFDVNALAAANPSVLEANSGRASDGISTGSLNISYAINDSVELYASVGQGFHSNDARGIVGTRDPSTGNEIASADPLVRSTGSEIGARLFLTERLNASLVIWQLDIDSELLFVGDAGNSEDTGVDSHRQGLELTGYYQLAEIWSLDLEYSYADSKFTESIDGFDDIPGALEHVVSGGIGFRRRDGFDGYLRLRYFGDYKLDNGIDAQGSTLLNARIGYAFNDHLRVSLDALNLFDSKDRDIQYFYDSQLRNEPMPVGDVHFHIFEPRAFRIYLDYSF